MASSHPSISRFVVFVGVALVVSVFGDRKAVGHVGHSHDVSHSHDASDSDTDEVIDSTVSDGDTDEVIDNTATDGDTDVDVDEIPLPSNETGQLLLEVQPIQVCDDDGIVCAQVELFEAITDKIWGQAGIDVTFLPTNQLNDSTYLSADDNEFFELSFMGTPEAFGRHPDSTDTSGPLNLWFVDEIESSNGLVQYGNAWIGFNGVLINDDILEFGDQGRVDVIAHELGHNLGLRHSTFGAGGPENLMTSGSDRTVPESIDDIFPDGNGLSQLTSEQIDVAQNSPLVTVAPVDTSLPDDSLPVVDDTLPVVDNSPPVVDDNPPVTVVEKAPVDLLPMVNLPVVDLPVVDDNPPVIVVGKAPIDLFVKGSARDSAPTLLASAPPATIPESAPSLLTWLLLLPLGQKVYSRINR